MPSGRKTFRCGAGEWTDEKSGNYWALNSNTRITIREYCPAWPRKWPAAPDGLCGNLLPLVVQSGQTGYEFTAGKHSFRLLAPHTGGNTYFPRPPRLSGFAAQYSFGSLRAFRARSASRRGGSRPPRSPQPCGNLSGMAVFRPGAAEART